MMGLVLGLFCGAAIASVSLYVIFFLAQPNKSVASEPTAAPGEQPQAATAPQAVAVEVGKSEGAAEAQPAENGANATAPAASAESESAAPAAAMEWLGTMSNRIEDEIGSHTDRIEKISAGLRRANEGGSDAVLDAASQIMLANQQLQDELAAARVEISEHRAKLKELSFEARTDVLTGLANRRAFSEDLERRFEQWRRHDVPLSLVMVDIDHFKSINDCYTHAGGDAALRHMGEMLRSALRQMDIPARYGGEEFAIILPGTKLPDAINVAERLRATIAAKGFEYEQQWVSITASLGLATAVEGDSVSSIIERADQALYAAKQAGRNRAFVHDGDAHQPIGADKALVRHPFRDLQQIAPYKVGGPIPRADDFYPVRCYDLSVRGISFLSSTPPDFEALIIQLGNPPDARYMISSIANVAPMMSGDEQQYRVGCTFVSRLDPDEIRPKRQTRESASQPVLAGV